MQINSRDRSMKHQLDNFAEIVVVFESKNITPRNYLHTKPRSLWAKKIVLSSLCT